LSGVVVLGFAMASGCGDDDENGQVTPTDTGTGTGTGTGTVTGTGGSGGGTGGAGGGGGYTLDNVCAAISQGVCGAIQSCCNQLYSTFDQTACQAAEVAGCESAVAEVNSGNKTFNPDQVDPCMTFMSSFLSQSCYGTMATMILSSVDQKPCFRMFEGKVTEGNSCNEWEDCLQPTEATKIAVCTEDGGSGVCSTFELMSTGGSCDAPVQGPPPRICDDGLYCDFSAAGGGGGPPVGQCAAEVALGNTCVQTQLAFPSQCGWNGYCGGGTGGAGGASGTCLALKDTGQPCNSPFECDSFECNGSGSGGGGGSAQVCGSAEAIVQLEECTGSSGGNGAGGNGAGGT